VKQESDGFFHLARREEAPYRDTATTSNTARGKKTRFIALEIKMTIY